MWGGGKATGRWREGWLPPVAEAAAYEGVRRGDEAAFRAVAAPLQPTLRRLAALSTGEPADIDALAARAWEVALGGLDMFQWQTPFATWVAGLALAVGRSHAAGRPSPVAPLPAAHPVAARPGPADWGDLPWGSRWDGAWETLDAAVAMMPLGEREAVHVGDVERWSPRRACDVLGVTETAYHDLLADGRTRLRDSLAGLVAAPPVTASLLGAQTAAVAQMLRDAVDDRDGPLDARTVAVFLQWRAGRRRRWRLLPHRILPGTARPLQRSLP